MLVVILLKNYRTNLLYLTSIWEINDFQVSIHADVIFQTMKDWHLIFFFSDDREDFKNGLHNFKCI